MAPLFRQGLCVRVRPLAVRIAVIAAALPVLVPHSANAQQCTTDNIDNRGCAVIFEGPNTRAAREAAEAAARPGPKPPDNRPRFPSPLRMVDTYYAVAFHPGANDPWAIWKNQISLQNAQERVLAACNAVMGSGCQIIGSGANSFGVLGYRMGQPGGPQLVELGIGSSITEARQNLQERCKVRGYECGPLDFFGTVPERDNAGIDFSITYYPTKQTVKRRPSVK